MKGVVRGSRELSAKLAAMGRDVSKDLQTATVAGALVIQNLAKEKAVYVTGNMRRSIHIGGHEEHAPDSRDIVQRGQERVPQPQVSGDEVTVFVGTDVEYAPAVEFGDEETGRAAKPFMRPAYDEGREDAMQEVGAALADIIRAAAE